MDNNKEFLRCSGILTHVTSLPSPYGIGDMGPGTYNFLRFLSNQKQSIWQILPLGPTAEAFSHSPYMTVSAFAGNPLLISPEILFQEGFISSDEYGGLDKLPPYSVDFPQVCRMKTSLLRQAFARFKIVDHPDFVDFTEKSEWLKDYSLFQALKNHYAGNPWYSWTSELVSRQQDALEKAEKLLQPEILYQQFEQYLFIRQWRKIHELASDLSIRIFGDIPIYISLDSADVWGNQAIFELDPETKKPTHVAGVPPDYFSETGQKWGNPLYRWNSRDKAIATRLTTWWISRFRHVFELVDIARIDHFRGFESYWSVPAHHPTALKGEWRKGPGRQFFQSVFAELGELPIVAEDLGEITKEVITLRDELGFPGMKVLQFAFDGNIKNDFLPFNYTSPNTFVYSGTHDNDTSVGWYLSERVDDKMRSRIKNCANGILHDDRGIHRDLIYMAMSSIANVCVFPLQDILGFGSDCRMNTPGTSEGNWLWRCSEEFLQDEKLEWLKTQTELFRRAPEELASAVDNLSESGSTIS